MTNAYLFITLIVFAMSAHQAYVDAGDQDSDIIAAATVLLFRLMLCGWAVWLLWEQLA